MWHDRLLARYDEACGEVGEATTRVWLAYLAACSLVFERGACGVYQTLVCKRGRGASGLPPTREDLYRDRPERRAAERFANADRQADEE
jgi:cyclopropane-fatty-acyl-phospholipid synthase